MPSIDCDNNSKVGDRPHQGTDTTIEDVPLSRSQGVCEEGGDHAVGDQTYQRDLLPKVA